MVELSQTLRQHKASGHFLCKANKKIINAVEINTPKSMPKSDLKNWRSMSAQVGLCLLWAEGWRLSDLELPSCCDISFWYYSGQGGWKRKWIYIYIIYFGFSPHNFMQEALSPFFGGESWGLVKWLPKATQQTRWVRFDTRSLWHNHLFILIYFL